MQVENFGWGKTGILKINGGTTKRGVVINFEISVGGSERGGNTIFYEALIVKTTCIYENTENIHIRGIFFVAFIGADYNTCS